METRIINNSIDNNYHSQINNTIIPLASCNTTSAIMYLKNNNILFDYPKEMQPEDYLSQILQSDEAIKIKEKLFPQEWAKNFRPQEIHKCLSWGINKLVGKEISKFDDSRNINDIVNDLKNGKCVIMSGAFTPCGHVVCVVGLEIKDSKIINFIIDDPFGNYWTNYKDHRGNNIKFPFDDFIKITRHFNKEVKYCHYI